MKNLGLSFNPNKKTSQIMSEAAKAEHMRGVFQDVAFRDEIVRLASNPKNELLTGIEVGKLSKEDQHFYSLFKKRQLTEDVILQQLQVIGKFPQAASSVKLLYYMLYELQEKEKNKTKIKKSA